MTAALLTRSRPSGRHARRPRVVEPPRESAIYDGSRHVGDLRPSKGKFVAYSAGGRKLGVFDDDRAAMRAVTSHARQLNEQNPKIAPSDRAPSRG